MERNHRTITSFISPPRPFAVLALLSVGFSGTAFAQTVFYVDKDSTAVTPNGTSWALAYQNVEDALSDSSLASGDQVWIAEGVYTLTGPGTTVNDSYVVPNGVEVYGAFLGNESDLDARAGSARLTVLTGDFNTDGDPANNLLHVVRCEAGNRETVIDSLTIADGNARFASPADSVFGGGIIAVGTDLKLEDCLIRNNSADFGGGLYFDGAPIAPSSDAKGLRMTRCFFLSNFARSQGGAVELAAFGIPTDGSPTTAAYESNECSWMTNCQFVRNRAGELVVGPGGTTTQGGGAVHFGPDRYERQDSFWMWEPDTSTGAGPGDVVQSTGVIPSVSFLVMNCRFTDNAVNGRGSAILIDPAAALTDPGRILITSTTMAGNLVQSSVTGEDSTIFVSGREVGATEADRSDLATILWYSIVVGDPEDTPSSDQIAGAGSYGAGDQDWIRQSTASTLQGSGYSGALAGGLVAFGCDIELTGTSVYGGTGPQNQGLPNVNVNPAFVNFTARNLRLGDTSPLINAGAGNVSAVDFMLDHPDLDDDADQNILNDDLGSTARFQDRIDYGCYERTLDSWTPPSGEPTIQFPVPQDEAGGV